VFEAHVPAVDAARLRIGLRATVTETQRPSRSAVLRRILPVASAGDQTTLAWLAPNPGEADPDLDRFGTAIILVGANRRSAAIPDSAVVEDDLTGTTRIAIIDVDRRARWVTVTLGAGAEGWRELRAPTLAPGIRVIIDGQHGLPDSTRVRSES